jgi:hypothetical protein
MAFSWNGIRPALLGPVVFVGFGAGMLSQVRRYDQRPELALFLSVTGAGFLLYGLHHLRKENRARKASTATPDTPQPQRVGSPSPPLPPVAPHRSFGEWLRRKHSFPKRIAIFFAIYLAAAALISIRMPVIVTGVVYENGGTRAYSYEAGEYAFTLMTNKTSAKQVETGGDPYTATTISSPSSGSPPPPAPLKPRSGDIFDQVAPAGTAAKPLSDGGFGDAPKSTAGARAALSADFNVWDVKSMESAPALDVGRYASRLEVLFIAIGALWFGFMPYYSELKRGAWLLPLFLYAIAAIWRSVYVPITWVERHSYCCGVSDSVYTRAATIPLWRITTQNVRYGLVFFEEFAMLAILALCYGCAFAVIRHLRPDERILAEEI